MIVSNGARQQPAFFRSYDQMRTEMFDLQRRYPDLVRVEDIGDSYEHTQGGVKRDILALRLTSPKGRVSADGAAATKPSTVWLGSTHPTETANPELLLRWAQRTVAGYGTDPTATALLDGREINIIPIVNPDGHAVVEQGYRTNDINELRKRKNTHGSGIDLNRNFDYKWGLPGSSADPKSSRYHGTHPASEPETQAVQGFLERVKPSVFIDWHSPGKDVLYPWGWTKDPAPHVKELSAIAGQFGRLSGYKPMAAVDYSLSQGTTEDFAYGHVGAMAFTVETGPSSRQNDREFERSWKDVSPIMDYAASIADAPGERAQGPGVKNVSIDVARGLLARVSDATAGGHAIVAAEAFTDPTTKPGSGVALHPVDGTFDTASERVTIALDQLQAGAGTLVQVRAKDADGNWGPATAAFVPTATSTH